MVQHWGWLIAIYLFLGGLGASAHLFSFLAEKGYLGDAGSLARIGYYIGSPLVAMGAGLLIFDLGQGLHKPWLIILMFTNYRSVMTWGIYILSAFIFVGLARAYLAWTKKESPKILDYSGAFLALSTCMYTGMLLYVVKAIPFWNIPLIPVLFVVSALSTGLSSISIVAHFTEKGELKEGRALEAHWLLLLMELFILVVIFGLASSGGRGPVAQLSANKILFGSYALPFWIGLIGLGLVVPLFVYTRMIIRKKKQVRSNMKNVMTEQSEYVPCAQEMENSNVATMLEVPEENVQEDVAVASEHHGETSKAILLSDGAVIFGGFLLRCLIIFASLPTWNSMLG